MHPAVSGTDIYMEAMCASIADVDGNGHLDIYCTNTSSGSILLMNNGDETFTEEAGIRGCKMQGQFGWGASFVDMDIFVSTASFSAAFHDNLFLNNGSGFFTAADYAFGLQSVPEDISYGNSFGDVNDDGFPDLMVNNHYTESILWESNGNENNWLKYKLAGTTSNRDGIGSYLTFYLDGASYLRSTNSGEGFLAQQSYTKIFGMGEYESVDSLSILWPSGHSDWYYDLAPDSTYQFMEGATLDYTLLAPNGLHICPGESTVLSIQGNYESLIWNDGESSAMELEVLLPGTVNVQIIYEYGIVQELDIEVSSVNPGFGVSGIFGTGICPEESEAEVDLVVSSSLPYEVFWDGIAEDLASTLSLGGHELSIVDTANCILEYGILITQYPETSLEIFTENPGCYGESSGELVLGVLAEEPFEVLVNNEPFGLYTFGLPHGEYEVQVIDAYGCIVTETVDLIEPEELTLDLEVTPDYGEGEGVIEVFISGGTSPYLINGGKMTLFSGLTANTYSIEVCDSSNCCVDAEAIIEFAISLDKIGVIKPSIHPNPAEAVIYLKTIHIILVLLGCIVH